MRLIVDIASQTLRLLDPDDRLLREYSVSTGLRGEGELRGSFRTPRGLHVVRARIGSGLPSGAVLKGRRWTGEIATAELVADQPDRDWILSRILWLSGCQPGLNRLGACDTMARYIYIHGTPDSEPMGVPGSHGCIRMRNADVIDLFERVPVGAEVLLLPPHADEPASFPLVKLDWCKAKVALSAIRHETEADAADSRTMHFLVWNWQGNPVAYARLSPEGRADRLEVIPEWRGRGLEEKLLQALLGEARGRGWF